MSENTLDAKELLGLDGLFSAEDARRFIEENKKIEEFKDFELLSNNMEYIISIIQYTIYDFLIFTYLKEDLHPEVINVLKLNGFTVEIIKSNDEIISIKISWSN